MIKSTVINLVILAVLFVTVESTYAAGSDNSRITTYQAAHDGSVRKIISIDTIGNVIDTLFDYSASGVWSDDLEYYLFNAIDGNGYHDVYMYERSSGTTTQLTDHNSTQGNGQARFRDDEIWWLKQSGAAWELWRMNRDGSNQEQMSNFYSAGKQLTKWDMVGDTIFAAIQSNSQASTKEIFRAYVVDDGSGGVYVDWSNMLRLTNNSTDDTNPRASRDGSKLAVQRVVATAGYPATNHIVVMDPDGSNPQIITSGPGEWTWPVWSEDNSQIVCSRRYSTENFELWTINADGSDKQQLTFTSDLRELALDWRVWPYQLICCIGLRGDVNGDGLEADPVDLSFLVDYLFAGGTQPACDEEADIDADGSVANPVDLSFLVDYLFAGGAAPYVCGGSN